MEAEVSLKEEGWSELQSGLELAEEAYLEVLGDFTDEALEGELADEELGRLLVATDFTEGDGSGTETMRLLDTTGRGLDIV